MNSYPEQLAVVLATMEVPSDVLIRCWVEEDLPEIQRLSEDHGWPTQHTPEVVLSSWRNAWPALVAVRGDRVVGYVKGMTDQNITTYIADLLVAPDQRRQGIGRLLLEACQRLYPHAYLLLVAEKEAIPFYESIGFQSSGETYFKWDRNK